MLYFARAVPFGSESCGTEDHILLSQFLRLPQPGGPGPRTYTPQEQGGPVITPGTEFPFRRLLRLAGLRWRYSNPPPHGKPDYQGFTGDYIHTRDNKNIVIMGDLMDFQM
jgi:hypothetical protein